MNLFEHLAILALLVLAAGFLSLTEIALAGARKIKLKLLAEAGDERARKVITLQAQSADFFAASQLGLNAIAILGGILGEGALRPFFLEWLSVFYTGPGRENIAFTLSFVFVTTLFVLFSDLMPKRLAFLNAAPRLLIQPLERLEGGLSQVEQRILMELGMGAGARKLALHVGEILDADGVRSRLQ